MTQEDIEERFRHKFREAQKKRREARQAYRQSEQFEDVVISRLMKKAELEGIEAQGIQRRNAKASKEYEEWIIDNGEKFIAKEEAEDLVEDMKEWKADQREKQWDRRAEMKLI